MFTKDQIKALKATGLTEEQLEYAGHGAAVADREANPFIHKPVDIESMTCDAKGRVVITTQPIDPQGGELSSSGKAFHRISGHGIEIKLKDNTTVHGSLMLYNYKRDIMS